MIRVSMVDLESAFSQNLIDIYLLDLGPLCEKVLKQTCLDLHFSIIV